MELSQSLDERAEERGFRPSEARVLQIEIVHELGDVAQRGVVHAEPGAEHLERAAVALMREVPLEHVEA